LGGGEDRRTAKESSSSDRGVGRAAHKISVKGSPREQVVKPPLPDRKSWEESTTEKGLGGTTGVPQ